MKRAPLLISFSGIDGAGKSTQINHVCSLVASLGYRTRLIAFWDDVAVGARYREDFVHKVYKSENGIGAPGRPVARRDKNVRRWYLTLARHCLYLVDAVHLRWVLARARRSGCDVIVMDRYVYDELVNLPLLNPLTRCFVRVLAALVPRPHLAYLLDADPEAALARKPEYPVEFMRGCREAYFKLANLLGTMSVVPPLPLPEAEQAVADSLFVILGEHKRAGAPKLEPAA